MTDTAFPSLFDDDKDPQALRTIGEVADALSIKQHVLRYWEEQFPMLKPVKRSGGRRYYRPEDVALLSTINRLVHVEGYTLKGARKALTKPSRIHPGEPGTSPGTVSNPASLAPADTDRLRSIRDRLAAALEAA